MEFKGTKGIWTIRETFDPKYDQPTLSIDSIEAETEDLITVWSGQDLGDKINEVTRADALLISKAPEMLSAIQEFCDRVEKGEVRSTNTYNKFKKLIKEATQID